MLWVALAAIIVVTAVWWLVVAAGHGSGSSGTGERAPHAGATVPGR